MGLEATKLVCISLGFPERSPVGRDYVAGIASKSDGYAWIKDSFLGFLVDGSLPNFLM